mgnify:CR=1 FL=1
MAGDKRKQTVCRRCGTCCLKGGPALHTEDLPLLTGKIITPRHLYTVRTGEIVRNIDDRLMPLEQEIVKIKGDGEETWACTFYDSNKQACRIYAHRPVECRALQCWDPGPLRRAMALPYIHRSMLLGREDELFKVLIAHEQRCAYPIMEKAVRALEGRTAHQAVEHILDILHYDHVVRTVVPKRLTLDPDTVDFFFGRPMRKTLRMYGLTVRQEGDNFRLVSWPIDNGTQV